MRLFTDSLIHSNTHAVNPLRARYWETDKATGFMEGLLLVVPSTNETANFELKKKETVNM